MLQKLITEAEKEFDEYLWYKYSADARRDIKKIITKSYEAGAKREEIKCTCKGEHGLNCDLETCDCPLHYATYHEYLEAKGAKETRQKLLKEIEELYEMPKDYPEQLRRIGYQDALISIKKLLI